ncbi:MAG: NAD(+) synthase, partial [Oscillospiraceae bacterium]|nr:NAD(+) synthase [Oscillospiraceae bacterium]
MWDGFIKAAVGTPKVQVADCRHNAEQTFQIMRQANAMGVSLLVLPELGLTGCTCGDLFLQPTLLNGAMEALGTVLEATRHLPVVTVLGMPIQRGGNLYSCAAVIQNGKILGIVPKDPEMCFGGSGTPRYFSRPPEYPEEITLPGGFSVPFGRNLVFSCETLPALTLGVCLGDPLETEHCRKLAEAGATIIANPSAGCALVGKQRVRRRKIASLSSDLSCGILSAEAGEGESSADLIFAGHNLIAENGSFLGEGRFETGLVLSELDVLLLEQERLRTRFPHRGSPLEHPILFSLPCSKTALTRYISKTPFVPEDKVERTARCEEVLLLCSMGLKKRLEYTGAKKAVLGLSGGLDSTLATLITMIAMNLCGLPAENVIAVTMPCFGTTDRTRDNAVELAERLGATLRHIDISGSV